MLSIKNIKKVYKTGPLVQQALGGVSLSLRDSEFVAVLGASGSGKTTLLNIIGGLDRYDEGDLIINGVSTKKYSDRDWDSYRNHTVGFVFQSYNLIPHQTVLKNVELALTISGIPSRERTAKAKEALIKVGLEEHIHKKPSQLSGGQMQRVAIARALVNDPDILLADEPTGALDSDTSIQVMDLLKEVASDRLVVMVTHNPELAEKYATRIVTLKDGMITSDSDPYEPDEGEAVHRNLGRASMSFFTSLVLSFNNLWTKKARTILVAFAGSIGIIGIAMILALSTGANQYIQNVEEESLQSYPLTINSASLDLMSLYNDASSLSDTDTEVDKASKKDTTELDLITSLLTMVRSNDLKSLKAYFESDECDIYDYVQALEYEYNLSPHIYREYKSGWRQINPGKILSSLGFSDSESMMNGLFSSFSSSDTFFSLPRDKELLKATYELKSGRYPQNSNECVIVLSRQGRVTDMTLYILGLKDFDSLDEMIQAFTDGEETVNEDPIPGTYYYNELIGAEFSLLSPSSYYTYDEGYKVWTDRSSDKKYMEKLLENAEKLKVVGVVQPGENSSSSSLNIGIGYPAELIDHIIDMAAESDIVKAQLKDREINVFTGKPFGEEQTGDALSLSSLFKVDEKAIKKAFSLDKNSFDLSSLDLSSIDFSSVDLSSAISAKDLQKMMPELKASDIQKIFDNINFNITEDTLKGLFSDIVDGYTEFSKDDARTDISRLQSSVAEYLQTEDAKKLIADDLNEILSAKTEGAITEDDLTSFIEYVIAGYPEYLSAQGIEDDGEYKYISSYLSSDTGRARISEGAQNLLEKLRKLIINSDDVRKLTTDIISGYERYADEEELPSVSYILGSFGEYLKSGNAKKLITNAVEKSIDKNGVNKALSQFESLISKSMEKIIRKVISAMTKNISSVMTKAMSSLGSGLSKNLLSAFDFDTDALSKMFKTNMSAEELKDLMVSLLSGDTASYDANLKKLGYADVSKPSTITIYPSDFESKNHIKALISEYNARVEKNGEDEKVIKYTDMVDALMSSVTIIIDVISYVLIAFVAISLVVSSIMIGVITYISVLERRKEIGILRAIGASKRNISQVFNAETFIIGTLAGIIGVVITELLIIPANLIIHSLSGVENINAVLPPLSALLLILLSVALTLIGGLIPSRKAAKSDPVTALRSE